ncbi:MAG: MoxR family ATPase [Clostridium sp.]|nr:MoxR family ATPase [Clostridium sp.]
MENAESSSLISKIKASIQKVIIGKTQQIDLVMTAFLAGGHILLEDTPGTGKTMLAKALAASVDGQFKRVQFTPDLLPSDVTGLNIYNQKNQEFEFVSGPVFTNILLADEINRATPRTQSCLLEAMAERQVTTDGVTRTLPQPFFLIATENPIETTGTFPLPEAQLDRFDLKISMGFPSTAEALDIMEHHLAGNPVADLTPVCDLTDIRHLQEQVSDIYIHKDLKKYIVDLVQATGNHAQISLGINPRGMLSLTRLCQAYALIQGRTYVTPEDIKHLIKPCFSHRLLSFSGASGQNLASSLLDDIMSTIPVPTENFEK